MDSDKLDDLQGRLLDEARLNGGNGAYAWKARMLCGKAAEAITALRAELDGLRFVASVIEDPDQQLCCSGHECGCRGATVGQLAAWSMNDSTPPKGQADD